MFHITLFEQINFSISLQEVFYHENNDIIKYEVKRIIEYRLNDFLVKWKGYEDKDNTWKLVSNFVHCKKRIRKYQLKIKRV